MRETHGIFRHTTHMNRKRWSRDELVIAFNLYCRTPFGRLHKSNSDIVNLAKKLGRTPSAIAMKLVNFASFDPVHHKRNVKGLSNTSKDDRKIWEEFHADWEKLAIESQYVFEKVSQVETNFDAPINDFREKLVANSEVIRSVKVRLIQGFFRETVLASYDVKCALCQLNLPELLNASHIIPWSSNVERRADPTNGISLCALHDRAFDRGLITFDDSYNVVISNHIRHFKTTSAIFKIGLLDIESAQLTLPSRFKPDLSAIRFHRENIFKR